MKKFLFFLIIPAVFLVDRLFKLWILREFPEGHGFAVIQNVFHVTRVNNTGAAFGILKDAGPFLIGFSLVSVVVFAVYLFRRLSGGSRTVMDAWFDAAWALVIGGALGNLYDRWTLGYVVDFLDFRVWPVFNVADAGICVGAGLLMLGILKPEKA